MHAARPNRSTTQPYCLVLLSPFLFVSRSSHILAYKFHNLNFSCTDFVTDKPLSWNPPKMLLQYTILLTSSLWVWNSRSSLYKCSSISYTRKTGDSCTYRVRVRARPKVTWTVWLHHHCCDYSYYKRTFEIVYLIPSFSSFDTRNIWQFVSVCAAFLLTRYNFN